MTSTRKKNGRTLKRASRTINVQRKPNEDEAAAYARTWISPSVQGASTQAEYAEAIPTLDLNALISELSGQTQALQGGDWSQAEALLFVQAHTLDRMFNCLARRAINAESLGHLETYLRLGLRAQSQCRATLETLAAIKIPQSVAFVRQQNIGYNQQVNNNASPGPRASRTRENENPPNKLMETQNGERLDAGATGTTICADTSMATVEEVYGPKDAGG